MASKTHRQQLWEVAIDVLSWKVCSKHNLLNGCLLNWYLYIECTCWNIQKHCLRISKPYQFIHIHKLHRLWRGRWIRCLCGSVGNKHTNVFVGKCSILKSAGNSNYTPTKIVVCECFPFPRCYYFRFHVSFRGCRIKEESPFLNACANISRNPCSTLVSINSKKTASVFPVLNSYPVVNPQKWLHPGIQFSAPSVNSSPNCSG